MYLTGFIDDISFQIIHRLCTQEFLERLTQFLLILSIQGSCDFVEKNIRRIMFADAYFDRCLFKSIDADQMQIYFSSSPFKKNHETKPCTLDTFQAYFHVANSSSGIQLRVMHDNIRHCVFYELDS